MSNMFWQWLKGPTSSSCLHRKIGRPKSSSASSITHQRLDCKWWQLIMFPFHCNTATVQQCNTATPQQCKTATVQHRNTATPATATVQHCNSTILIRLDYYRFKGLHKRNKLARGASPTYIHSYLNIQKENYS